MHSLLRNLDRALAKYLAGLLPEERRYFLLVPVTGVLAGTVAVALEKLLVLVQNIFWASGEMRLAAMRKAEVSPLLLISIPATGGAIVAIAALFFRKRDRLQGTSRLMEALAFQKGRLPVLETLMEGLVSITAVGTGASLGREGAMMNSGATLGSWLGSKLRLEDHHVKILLAAGAAGGIAAAYNVPIGASLFAMEVLLGSFAFELFGPIIICSLIATVISHEALGSDSVYAIPAHQFVHDWEILLDLILGILLGLVSVVFIRVFSGADILFRWLKPVEYLKPVLAMLALGCAGIFFPALFGNGYDTVNAVLQATDPLSMKRLLALPLLKIFVSALCRAGGVPGGLFTPSLFVGALLGNAFGIAVNHIFPYGSTAAPPAYALVGMGAIIAGTIQAPITAVLMIFEMTHDYSIILPLMSACIASGLVSHLLQKGSLYTEPLKRRGIRLPPVVAPTWLKEPAVRSVIIPGAVTISPAERFEQVMETFLKTPEGQDQLYVTNREGAFLGAISLHEIKSFFRETENLDSVIAADLVNPAFPAVLADDPISRAIELLSESDFERLPVLENATTRKLLGTVSKRKLLSAFTEANLPQLEVKKKPTPQEASQ